MRIKTRKDASGQLAQVIRDGIPAEFYDQYTQPNIIKGDFVSVFDSLCEVISSTKSEFGYKSFKVRFLTQPPISEHQMDWYPAINVKKQIDARDMQQGVLDLLTIEGERPRLDNRHLRRAMRDNAVRLWSEWITAQRAR